MLALKSKSMPQRISKFFHAGIACCARTLIFFPWLRLPDGPWLSILTGWRRHGVTYVDLQMNDMHYKKESISAVMRAFMLEHEIGRGQKLINFVGGPLCCSEDIASRSSRARHFYLEALPPRPFF